MLFILFRQEEDNLKNTRVYQHIMDVSFGKKAQYSQLYFIIHITHKQEKLWLTQKTLFLTFFTKHSACVASLESVFRIWSWEKNDNF